MTAIALPERKILLPRFEFPAWVRRIGDPLKMLSPLGGALTPLGVTPRVVSNWWEAGGATGCVAAYAPKGAASLAASYVNLANPGTYDVAPGVAPTFDAATGWTFNGSNQYLTTGISPANDQSWSAIIRYADANTVSNYAVGGVNGSSSRFEIYPRFSDGKSYMANGTEVGYSGAQAHGVLAIAGNKAYRDGVALSDTIGAWGGASLPLDVGAVWNGVIHSGFYNGKVQAFAIYNTTLTAGMIEALTTAINAL